MFARFLHAGTRVVLLSAILSLVGCAAGAPPLFTLPAGIPGPASAPASNVETKIRSAMSAAPLSISRDAAIMDYPAEAGGPFISLREGTNGWTCFPDWLATPGDDPQCNDKTWMIWMDALINGTTPALTEPGIAYMLAGGSDPSNDDPSATQPAPGQPWLESAPHLMLIRPGAWAGYPTDPRSGGPWVMFGGTPFEHLMVPVDTCASNRLPTSGKVLPHGC